MCGRMVQALTPEMVREVLKIRDVNTEPSQNYNITPKQRAGVVRLNPKTRARTLDELQWWLVPAWADAEHKFSTFNAKSEELTDKKMFKGAWEGGRRCLIPINAYYEWRDEGRIKQPYAISRNDQQLITLAGLWEAKRLENGDTLRTFTVITAEAKDDMAELHNRIPVMIEEEDWAGWLGEIEVDTKALLHPPNNDLLTIWPVSRAVGNIGNNDLTLLKCLPDEARLSQQSIFSI
jgi:putative SOS response-associated peptidase YedK